MISKEFKLAILFTALVIMVVVLFLSSFDFLKNLDLFSPTPEKLEKVAIEMLSDEKAKVIYAGKTYITEVADTEAERTQGLMFRESLDPNQGMLFVFDHESIYPFWMKNTVIPLKMIWIDSNFNIVHEEIAQPCLADPCRNYTPSSRALYVLEINP